MVWMFSLFSAFVLRWMWHSSFAIGIPVGGGMHRAFDLDSIAFWALLGIALALLLISFLKRAN